MTETDSHPPFPIGSIFAGATPPPSCFGNYGVGFGEGMASNAVGFLGILISSVANGIEHILRLIAIHQIFGGIIESVTIEVTDNHPWRSWSQCEVSNQMVNKNGLFYPTLHNSDSHIMDFACRSMLTESVAALAPNTRNNLCGAEVELVPRGSWDRKKPLVMTLKRPRNTMRAHRLSVARRRR